MKKIILEIEGMTCSACSNGLEKYLNKQNGIINASVNLIMANATIDYDESILDLEKIEKYVKQAGFKSLGVFKGLREKEKSKKEKIYFGVYTILAIILMYISMGHMIGLPLPNVLNPHINSKVYALSLFAFATLFLIYGIDILKNGIKNLIHGIPNMDTLVFLGVISSYLYSVYNMLLIFSGKDSFVMNLYFESASIVIYFVKLGRYIDSFSKDKTKEAIKKLVEITPSKATIEVDGVEKSVTLDEIKKGDILVVAPGEKVAVDGKIISGTSHFDESFITGESKPVQKDVGDTLVAGSLNYDGYVRYEAQKIGKDSTISEIVRLVIDAGNQKTEIEKIADKISGYFVPFVILIAIFTFVIYIILEFSFQDSIITFVTILVVACPCSLGLATPLAIIVSEGICVENGILVKKGEVLENASKVNVVMFDKTGTLTYGRLKIFKMYNYASFEEKQILQLVASLESASSHPIATAFENYIKENNLSKLKVENFSNIAGYGITGNIDGKEIILGNSKIIEKYNIENKHTNDEEKLKNNLCSIIYVAIDRKIVSLIGINDVIRENAKQVILDLNKLSVKTVMLTGDNKEVATKIGEELGINKIYSNVLPSEKSNIVKKLKEEGNIVMMCGDGINDSPALANANIGVSVASGTDIAIDSASVVLTKNDLNSVVKLILISKKTLTNIKENLFWAFIYNTLMIPIAAGMLKKIGISITPMVASLAMILSSFTVTLNALRLKKQNLEKVI